MSQENDNAPSGSQTTRLKARTGDLEPDDPEYKRLVKSLRTMGLVHSSDPSLVSLTGGVSSLIVLVEDGTSKFCAKSALSKLKVAADWQVPVHRNQAEVAWMHEAAQIVPAAVPEILGADSEQNIFAMQWLNPDKYPVWKQQLLDGNVSTSVADKVGFIIGKIHAQTARNPALAERFNNDADFDALRLDPYLRATAKVHTDLKDQLLEICRTTAQTRLTLIHGDVSPKNILTGSNSPILLDAECATYGDPAFDLAFCLNHLILKSVHLPAHATLLHNSFKKLYQRYLSLVSWEPVIKIEARTAALLPALALARVDGKSPAEYLTSTDREHIRHTAKLLITKPVTGLDEFLTMWEINLR